VNDAPAGALVLDKITVAYRGAPAVRDATLTVPRGGIVGLAGRNGAGKTSTLRAVSSLVPHGGQASLDGSALPRSPEQVTRIGISHVPEGRGLVGGMTTLENLRLACAALRRPYSAIDELLDSGTNFAALRPLLGRKAGFLSGGEQQLLAVARGLVCQPRFLLVDELSLGLSPKARAQVMDAVTSAARRHAIGVLLVDQNLRALLQSCDRVFLMREGRTEDASAMPEENLDTVYLD
jgi:branched-chain amino acid transport system ATP-binding protein